MERILLINWDNYPHIASGGVYAWCKSMIDNLPDFEFVVLNFLANPNVSGVYNVPANVSNVIEMPLYGCIRHEEFSKDKINSLIPKIAQTNQYAVEYHFLPIFIEFVKELISNYCDCGKISSLIFELHELFLKYDVKKCVEHPLTYNAFAAQLDGDDLYANMTAKESLDVFQLIQRMIQTFSINLPRINIIHASNAWFPAMTGIYAKIENSCPMVVTEHGVAFKDLLLYNRLFKHTEAYNIFWKVFSANIIKTVYDAADAVVPVSTANAAAAESIGINPSKIRIIYNGIDTNKFKPMEVSLKEFNVDSRTFSGTDRAGSRRPVVVYMGRIELLKDVLDLIEAIKYVKVFVPNIMCLIFGSSMDLEYSLSCENLVSRLKLADNIKFMGNTISPEKAYNLGDVIVLSSIREGFPYTVIEAMACGKAVVSTDVGGVRDALKRDGLLVRSRHPHSLAKSIVKLLKNEELRRRLAASAVESVNEKFTQQRSIHQYRNLYSELLLASRISKIKILANRRGKVA